MIASLQEIKLISSGILRRLGVNQTVYSAFNDNEEITLFDSIANDRCRSITDSDCDLQHMISECENRLGVKVYAVLHSYLPIIGETYDLLYVSSFTDDFKYTITSLGRNYFLLYGYCVNVSYADCSESGSIYVKVDNSGFIRRVF